METISWAYETETSTEDLIGLGGNAKPLYNRFSDWLNIMALERATFTPNKRRKKRYYPRIVEAVWSELLKRGNFQVMENAEDEDTVVAVHFGGNKYIKHLITKKLVIVNGDVVRKTFYY